MKLMIWFAETRPAFLLLSIVLVFLGTSVAIYEGFFNPIHALLALIGLILLHISVNVLNDYFDYKSGIDLDTKRTPFSGGSGILPAQLLQPSSVYKFGIACLILGVIIGIYFIIVQGILLTPIVVIGAFSVYFYTTKLTKWMVGEIFAGLGLGALPVLGSYFIQTATYSLTALIASIPPFILTHNLLFLNEFPDVEPDKKRGRRNIVIALGREKASKLYSALMIFMYCWIILFSIIGLMPLYVLISLLTIPFAIKAIRITLKHHSDEGIIPALAANVITVLVTQALMGVGFLIAKFI